MSGETTVARNVLTVTPNLENGPEVGETRDEVRDGAGFEWVLERDALARPKALTAPDGGRHDYGYDRLSNLAGIVDSNGVSVAKPRDAAGRLVSQSDGTSGTWGFGYDYDGPDPAHAVGELVHYDPPAHPSGASIGYDTDGRLETIDWGGGAVDHFVHDPFGRLDGTWNEQGTDLTIERYLASEWVPGEPLVPSTSYATHTLAVTGVSAANQPVPVSFEHTHTYDTEGRVVRVLGAGYQIGYRYDAVGRQKRIGLMNGSTWIAYVDYVPGPTGRVDHAAFSNGVTTHVAYDALARLARIRTIRGATSLFDATYGYVETFNDGRPATDARSLITSITYGASETYAPADSRAYWYDGKRRLLGASYSSAGNADYAYEYTLTDEPSRLKTPNDQGVDVAWTNSRPTHIGGLDVDVAPNGSINRIGPAQAPEYTFTRDRRDRVTAIGGQCAYSDVRYTPLGLRVRYTDTAGTHLEFDDGPVLVDAAADGTIQRAYVFAPNGFTPVMILQKEGEQLTPYFVHCDHLGTPLYVTNVSANIVWKARYDPYGTLLVSSEYSDADGDGAVFEQPIRFAGQMAISGNDCAVSYNKARYYMHRFAMYDSYDPVYFGLQGLRDTLRVVRYAYAASNPMSFLDPFGLQELEPYSPDGWGGENSANGGDANGLNAAHATKSKASNEGHKREWCTFTYCERESKSCGPGEKCWYGPLWTDGKKNTCDPRNGYWPYSFGNPEGSSHNHFPGPLEGEASGYDAHTYKYYEDEYGAGNGYWETSDGDSKKWDQNGWGTYDNNPAQWWPPIGP